MSKMSLDAGNYAQMMRAMRGTDLEALYRQPNADGAGAADGVSPLDQFSNLIEKKVDEVNKVMAASDAKIEGFVRGEETSIHDVMIATTKADLNFKLMATVTRKVIEAYQDIMRMQV
ncbi:MAG TPA: flagellar hook-basal body complex protein FliE [Myxococcales bacterium]|nr:flagellar hook-basal body complex protein FliE [Myxococcales bacterium]